MKGANCEMKIENWNKCNFYFRRRTPANHGTQSEISFLTSESKFPLNLFEIHSEKPFVDVFDKMPFKLKTNFLMYVLIWRNENGFEWKIKLDSSFSDFPFCQIIQFTCGLKA